MGNTLMFKSDRQGKTGEVRQAVLGYTFTEMTEIQTPCVDQTTVFADGGGLLRKMWRKRTGSIFNVDSGYWWIELGGQYEDIIRQAEDIRDELLKCVYGVWDHLKNCGDHGLANYDLDWVGIVPGYRESRRLEGDYILTENDVRANRIFEDAVAYGGWPMDEHTRGGIMDFDKLPSRILNFEGNYTIPYRCYYSKDVSNLMMAGEISALQKWPLAPPGHGHLQPSVASML